MSIKEAVIAAVGRLPDDANVDDVKGVLEQIETLAAIKRGLADADAGKFVSEEELERRIASRISR
jgi:predicted transcriptional regulator